MRRVLYIILIFLVQQQIHAQDTECKAGCNHRSVARVNGASFYQNQKMNDYNINFLELDIKVEAQTNFVAGSCLYKAVVVQPMDTFAIEFKQNMILDSVTINNVKRNFTRSNDHIYVAFSPSLPAGSNFTAAFYYSGTVINGVAYGTDAPTGLRFSANVSEAYQAREWFPAKQLLNDKIDSAVIKITTDAGNKAGSNGLLVSSQPVGGGKVKHTWSTHYPMSYYMPCFAVGNYLEYRNYARPAAIAPDSILVQHYIVNNSSYFNSIKASLDMTPRFVEKYSELYGVYPFYKEKYGHSHALIGGGMEHQTMSTMQSFGSSIIAHELGHQWFGDNVTCATWNDIWVNEGFATYSDYLMNEVFPTYYSTPAATTMFNYHTDILSLPGGSVYVPLVDTYNEGRIFSGRLTYNKGAAILHTLRFEMQSDSLFFKTMRNYQQKFKDTFATAEDFKLVAEQTAGRNFNDFFQQWFYGQGYPTYSIVSTKVGADSLMIDVSQTTSMPAVTPFFKGLLELKIKSAQGDTTIVVNNTINNQRFRIGYSKTPTAVEVDPNNWIINKVGTVVTSIANISALQAGVKIFPNPTQGVLHIKLPANSFKNVSVTDMAGRLVASYVISNGVTSFTTMLHVQPGVYFIQLTGSKGRVVEKIIVDH